MSVIRSWQEWEPIEKTVLWLLSSVPVTNLMIVVFAYGERIFTPSKVVGMLERIAGSVVGILYSLTVSQALIAQPSPDSAASTASPEPTNDSHRVDRLLDFVVTVKKTAEATQLVAEADRISLDASQATSIAQAHKYLDEATQRHNEVLNWIGQLLLQPENVVHFEANDSEATMKELIDVSKIVGATESQLKKQGEQLTSKATFDTPNTDKASKNTATEQKRRPSDQSALQLSGENTDVDNELKGWLWFVPLFLAILFVGLLGRFLAGRRADFVAVGRVLLGIDQRDQEVRNDEELLLRLGFVLRLLLAIVAATWFILGTLPMILTGGSLLFSGLIGDTFGAVNSLFSGIALIAVAMALVLQMFELRHQRDIARESEIASFNTVYVQSLLGLANLYIGNNRREREERQRLREKAKSHVSMLENRYPHLVYRPRREAAAELRAKMSWIGRLGNVMQFLRIQWRENEGFEIENLRESQYWLGNIADQLDGLISEFTFETGNEYRQRLVGLSEQLGELGRIPIPDLENEDGEELVPDPWEEGAELPADLVAQRFRQIGDHLLEVFQGIVVDARPNNELIRLA